MKVILLTHEREVGRPTNTGILALNLFPQWCSRVIWSRVASNKEMLALLASQQAVVLFPKLERNLESDEKVIAVETETKFIDKLPDIIIILDATWQEAWKMLRQSPYLIEAHKFAFPESTLSEFSLRRNQIQGGLCTVECIIEMCRLTGMGAEAADLELVFTAFNQ